MPKTKDKPLPARKLRLPAQAAVDDLILLPQQANVPEAIIDPYKSLNKLQRTFVAALFVNYGNQMKAARIALNMPDMSDTAALEQAFLIRADPMVVEAIDKSVHFLISRRGELFIGALWQAFQIATSASSNDDRMRAIEFLTENVGTGLDNKESLMASRGNGSGDSAGSGVKSVVEAISMMMSGGVAGAVGAAVGNQLTKAQEKINPETRTSKMVPIDQELEDGN